MDPEEEDVQATASDILDLPQYRLLAFDKLLQRLHFDGRPLSKPLKAELKVQHSQRALNQISKRPLGWKVGQKRKELKIIGPPGSWQIDVVTVTNMRSTEDPDRLFLLLIEIPSRFIYAFPLQNHTMNAPGGIIDQYKLFVRQEVDDLVSIYGDHEFDSNAFRAYNDILGINIYANTADHDHITKYSNFLGILDIAVRNLRGLILKAAYTYPRLPFPQLLQHSVEIYNANPHRSLQNGHLSP